MSTTTDCCHSTPPDHRVKNPPRRGVGVGFVAGLGLNLSLDLGQVPGVGQSAIVNLQSEMPTGGIRPGGSGAIVVSTKTAASHASLDLSTMRLEFKGGTRNVAAVVP